MNPTILLLPLLLLPSTLRAEGPPTIRNSALECQWSLGSGIPGSLRVTDAISKKQLTIKGGVAPALVLPDGEVFEIGSVLSGFTAGRDDGSRTANIKSNPYGLEGRWSIALHEAPAYILQTLTLTATRDLPVKEIVFLDTPLPQAEIMGQVDGSVLRSGSFFLAIEHPLAKIRKTGAGRFRCSLPRGNTLRAGATWTYTFVIGTTPPGQFRRGFLGYLESRRAQAYRPFVHYNSWYHLNIARPDCHMTETECLETVHRIGRELTRKRNVKLDAFVWDDGWDDHNTLWGFHSDFPQGFKRLDKAGKTYGAGMGVWMSPWGGYSTPKQKRLKFGKSHGYEINARGFSMAGEKYGTAFRDRCLEMMNTHGVVFFKFDGMGGGNVVKGAEGEAAEDIDAVLKMTRDLRKNNPEVFISATVGTWPSPFWLLYVDSIWRQGGDTGFAGVGNGREQWITYRDAHTYRHIVRQAPCYPISSLMTGGLVIGERANPARMTLDDTSVRNEARSMVGSGTCLQELYIAPHLLTQPMWDAIAESIKWLRSRRDVFADIHWVGGDPVAREVYGWGGWHDGRGVLTLRNPSDQPATYRLNIVDALDLPPGSLKTRYALTAPYADQRVRAPHCATTAWQEIKLQPFEVLSFDVTAAKDAAQVDDKTYQAWRKAQREKARAKAADFLGS
jgi:hypothetical protein